MTPATRTALVALGSNLADRRGILLSACERLARRGLTLERASRLYETSPEGGLPEPPYLNAVLRARTALSPYDVLDLLLDVERELGREPENRRGSRTCDLDLLDLGGLTVEDPPALVLPHPRLSTRAFVLVPLCELDVHWVHPVRGETAGEMLARLDPAAGSVVPFGNPELWAGSLRTLGCSGTVGADLTPVAVSIGAAAVPRSRRGAR